MQKIIQINIAGRLIPIEADAYDALRTYLLTIDTQFANEEGKDDIIEDIESRIAELFSMKLTNPNTCIDRQDVQRIITTLGAAHELDNENEAGRQKRMPVTYTHSDYKRKTQRDKIFRDTGNKYIGGVCSGLSHYLNLDTTWVRLLFALLVIFAGSGVVIYLIAWAVIPEGTPAQLAAAKNSKPQSVSEFADR